MKFFNTAGPVNSRDHYILDPLNRVDIDEIMFLIQQKKYFVLHAPRQTGKTSMLLALMDRINREGNYRALYVNVEPGQTAREDVAMSQDLILSLLGKAADGYLNDAFLTDYREKSGRTENPHAIIFGALSAWAKASPEPTVLFVDEIDALIGDSLISVLRQLRAGYTNRPGGFPQSIILCGVRDVRDYRIHASSEKDPVTGGSAFNVKAESLRLDYFRRDETFALLQQHTEETGQIFDPEAREAIWDYSRGQPWLVNALAHEITFKMKANRDRSVLLTEAMVEQARENLILRRETHLDQLADKLKEPRVHRVIAPILAGDEHSTRISEDDISYVYDLGLVEKKPLRIANPIYREVIPRTLTSAYQQSLTQEIKWYLEPDGALNMSALLEAFQQFFRENSEFWTDRHQYKEAGPQLLLQAFLQRVINGGGRIEREYGLGSGRTDLFLTFSHPGGVQRIVMELKLRKGTRQATIDRALPQITGYMDRCGSNDGHLIIFDQTDAPWDEKIFRDQIVCRDRPVQIWGM